MALNVNESNFQAEVLESEKTVLVDFWAPWCGPCQMMGPVVEEIASENQDIKVCKVNVDENPSLASKYGVMSIPNFIVFKNAQPAAQTVGACQKADLLKLAGK
ncbi:thioredoxin [uncultured Treponema sp.]|uniref:thioredoxin n=1 Tax=uncultured Treponema sp. TaxID=162155 RepID=UPI00259357AC|nr:thioredoxin [uncultured Treponema sp.]